MPVRYPTSGVVRGRTTVVLTSKVAGYVRAVHVRSGESVAAGQLLVELEANATRATVSRAQADLARAMTSRTAADNGVDAARVAERLALTNRERDTQLLASGAIPRAVFDETEARAQEATARRAAAEAARHGADAAIEMARAAVTEGQATLSYARVTAPFAGRIVERSVDPGALASPGSTLLVLDDATQLRVETAVGESRATAVHVGDPVDVEVGETRVVGTVAEIVPNVDVGSRALLVKIDLPPAFGPLQSGSFARVHFTTGTRPRLVVPRSAVTSTGALDRVYVVHDNVARLRIVTYGDVQGASLEILSGLSAGEQVVANPALARDGMRVEVRP